MQTQTQMRMNANANANANVNANVNVRDQVMQKELHGKEVNCMSLYAFFNRKF